MILSDLRHENRKELFDIVRREREVTRAKLQELTGYSGPFIMNIVNEFIEKGILTLTGKKTGSVGRRPYTMVFNPDVLLSVGIEFAGSYILAGIVNLDGDIRYQTRQSILPGSDNFTEPIEKCIDRLLRTAKIDGLACNAIGIGIPAAVFPGNRQIRSSQQLISGDPKQFNRLFGQLEEKYQISIFLENDVNSRAIGEYYVRRANNPISDLMFLLYSDFGLGSGLILDGQPRHGISHHAGAIGSSVRDTEYDVHYGKKGWLEEQISRQALIDRFGLDVQREAPDERVLDYIAKLIAPFVANILNMLDFSQVVLGGRMFDLCGDALIVRLREYINRLTFEQAAIDRASTDYSGVVGSALMASNKICDVLL